MRPTHGAAMNRIDAPELRPRATHPRSVRSGAAPHHLLVRLQHEWDQLARTPRAVAIATAWHLPLERIDSLDDVLAHLGFGQRHRADHDDEAMQRLVELARGDELAARVVLQRLLPGVASIARRRSRSLAERQILLDDLVATAWTVIRTFPVDRRRHYVTVNLLRDVEYRGFRQHLRRLPPPQARSPHLFDEAASSSTTVSAAQELAELLELAADAGLPHADLELARQLAAGASTSQLARERRVTDRTIRNHRDSLTRRLRELALAG